jgi:hypothetical protein
MNIPIAVPASASITRVDSPPPEEGDSFMYNDYDGSSSEDMNSCASPLGTRRKTPGNSSRSELSSSLDDDGDGSLSLSSTDPVDNFDSFDPIDKDEDSDTSCNGYKFYKEETFPTGVDNVVHMGLAQLCCNIKAPLKAYNEILCWAQSAKLQGYSFSADAPHYRTLNKYYPFLVRGRVLSFFPTIAQCLVTDPSCFDTTLGMGKAIPLGT